ncbi:MAG: hypothetical protein ACJAT1_000285 [Marivirga sp.]|jgi:hypothetical protein
MIFVPFLTILVLVVLFQRKYAVASKERLVFYGFVLAKFIAAVLVGLLYSHYYLIPGDTFTVFYQAREWYNLLVAGDISWQQWIGLDTVDIEQLRMTLPNEPRTRFFAFICSYLMPISLSNYYGVALWMTFFQIVSLWLLTRGLINKLCMPKGVIYMGLLFVPSVTFWSAGLLKETMMLSCMANIVTAYLYASEPKQQRRWLYLFMIVFFTLILYQIKYYVVILMLPLGLLTYLFAEKRLFEFKSFKLRLSLFFVILILGTTAVAVIHPVFHSGLFFDLIKISHDQIASRSADSIINFNLITDPFSFVLVNTPSALVAAFFRPFIWEAFSVLTWAIGLETFFFTGVLVCAIYSLFKERLAQRQYWWLLAGLLYVLAAGLIITLSTPNFGSLVRYKVAYMPICWLMCLWLVNKRFSVRKL